MLIPTFFAKLQNALDFHLTHLILIKSVREKAESTVSCISSYGLLRLDNQYKMHFQNHLQSVGQSALASMKKSRTKRNKHLFNLASGSTILICNRIEWQLILKKRQHNIDLPSHEFSNFNLL